MAFKFLPGPAITGFQERDTNLKMVWTHVCVSIEMLLKCPEGFNQES